LRGVGCDPVNTLTIVTPFSFRPRRARYSNYFFKGVFGVVAISTVLFTGIGTAAKYTIEEAKRSEVLTKIDANNTANKAVVAAVSQAKPSPLPLPDDAGTKVVAFDADDASTDAKGHV